MQQRLIEIIICFGIFNQFSRLENFIGRVTRAAFFWRIVSLFGGVGLLRFLSHEFYWFSFGLSLMSCVRDLRSIDTTWVFSRGTGRGNWNSPTESPKILEHHNHLLKLITKFNSNDSIKYFIFSRIRFAFLVSKLPMLTRNKTRILCLFSLTKYAKNRTI